MTALESVAFRALGTTAALFVTDTEQLPRGRAILEEELAAIDLACSRFRPDSELSRVNRAAGSVLPVSELFLEAVQVGLDGARATGGLVDPTVGRAMGAIGYDRDFESIGRPAASKAPRGAGFSSDWTSVRVDHDAGTVEVPPGAALDLGATAKALAADRAARRIHDALGGGVLVSLGGDISTAGTAPAGGWIIRVADDHAGRIGGPGQSVTITDGGLATSSTTVRRWATDAGDRHHIVDPRTGSSATEVWRTVSVAGSSCVDANVASTAAIVQGPTAPGWLAQLDLPSRLVARTGKVVRVAGWPAAVPA